MLRSDKNSHDELRTTAANLFCECHLSDRVCSGLSRRLINMHAPHSHSTRHFAAERAPSAAAQWARLEGKSETMAADLIKAAAAADHTPRTVNDRFCPRCFASAMVGAAVALLIERLVMGD
jgi:hypothetical protein